MNTFHLIRKLWPFIRKYQGSLALALFLTLIGAVLAQLSQRRHPVPDVG